MNVDIRDVEAMRAIQPADAAAYLRANGWQTVDAKVGVSATWQRLIDGDEFEALLPLSAGFSDYALRMGELLAVLATAERRSQMQVYRDVVTSSADVVRIRIADPELNDGSLPIEEHAQIAQKARDLVLAAACAATEKRAVWHKRKPAHAMEHVRRVRIGQSEQGSYVVTVVSRVTPLLHGQNDQLFEVDAPFERRVTQTLAQALQALNTAAADATVTQEMAAFDNAVSAGVNANLCDAVVGLWGGDEVQRKLEFAFSWAPVRPVEPDAVRRVAISADRLPVIREAARQMRERAPVSEFELSGPVVRLDRAEGALSGKITVVGIVDEHQARIIVELSGDAYDKAVEAHRDEKSLRLVGTLVREGRGYALRNPSGIEIIDE